MASYASITMESIPLLPITTAVILPIALTIAATYLFTVVLAKPASVNVPLVGLDLGGAEKRKSKFVSDANSLLNEGYEKVGPGRGIGRVYLVNERDTVQKRTVPDHHERRYVFDLTNTTWQTPADMG